MKTNIMRSAAFTIVCIILGILIALQMKNINAARLTEQNLTGIQTRLIEYASKNNELSLRNAQLSAYVSQLENAAKADNTAVDAIVREKERYAIYAGLREVKNYGVVVTITCGEDSQIRDSVLRQFVNELRALGAQAVAINGERLVAMSEIRVSGAAIIINGNSYSRQGVFEIKAITDPKKESYVLSYLDAVSKSIMSDAALRNDQYEIRIEARLESIAFKLDLLTPKK
jgi:uncharacterized protein YlxW (UPF0749 family)